MIEIEVRQTSKQALVSNMAMENISRAYEKGETKGFMKILVDQDSRQILGASLLWLAGDEVIHCVLDAMYVKAPYTLMKRMMHIHPTVSESIPTLMGELKPLK
jgi:pyruvate/2-oxoglutarate dehydrogenase complex dihydrolipoamide dehydrogenase (E3) component